MVYVSLRAKIMPVAMLSILVAKITEPEYCNLSSFLVKASPLGSVKNIVQDAYILV